MDPLIPNPLTTPKDVSSFTVFTYAWVILLSIWGGLVNYVNKVRAGQTARFNVTEFIGDVFTSGFVGVLTFWLCQAAGIDPLLTACFVGISGHMGARAVAKMETWMGSKIGLAPDTAVVAPAITIAADVTVKDQGGPGGKT